MKKNKGITLIALVITIIVLLILAGVTIATLTGDNGLLQKATSAKQENEKSKELELIKLAVSAAQVTGEGKLTAKNLNDELRRNLNDIGIQVYESPNNKGWRYNEYEISEDGLIKIINKVYLYNQGDECSEVTGGWTTTGGCSKDNDRILLYGKNSTNSYVYTNRTVDVTAFDRICFELNSISTYQNYGNTILTLLKGQNSIEYVNTEVGKVVTCTIDTSGLQGEYLLRFVIGGVNTYKSELLSMYLEKDLYK